VGSKFTSTGQLIIGQRAPGTASISSQGTVVSAASMLPPPVAAAA